MNSAGLAAEQEKNQKESSTKNRLNELSDFSSEVDYTEDFLSSNKIF